MYTPYKYVPTHKGENSYISKLNYNWTKHVLNIETEVYWDIIIVTCESLMDNLQTFASVYNCTCMKLWKLDGFMRCSRDKQMGLWCIHTFEINRIDVTIVSVVIRLTMSHHL